MTVGKQTPSNFWQPLADDRSQSTYKGKLGPKESGAHFCTDMFITFFVLFSFLRFYLDILTFLTLGRYGKCFFQNASPRRIDLHIRRILHFSMTQTNSGFGIVPISPPLPTPPYTPSWGPGPRVPHPWVRCTQDLEPRVRSGN